MVPIHAAITELLQRDLPEYDYEILFIDNKSEDNTRALIRDICSRDPNTRAIFNAKNFGQFNSPYYGLLRSSGDCAILMVADFQDPVHLITELVREWEQGHKVVCCVKTSSKERGLMYGLRSLYYKTIKSMSRVDQIEHFTGFGLYDRTFIQTLRNLNDPVPFLRGIVAELGPDRKIIEYEQATRRSGKSSNNLYSLFDAAMISFTSYTKSGLRLATIAGFICSALGLVVAFSYLVLKLLFWDTFPAGAVPILIGVFLFGSLQLLFIGLVGEYILSMNTRLMNRPLVIEEERVNFDSLPCTSGDGNPHEE